MGSHERVVTRSLFQLRPTKRTQLAHKLGHSRTRIHAISTRTPSTNGTCFNSGQQSRLTRHQTAPIDELKPNALVLSHSRVAPNSQTDAADARSPHSSSSTLSHDIRAVPHLSKPCLPQCIAGAGRGRKSTSAPSVEQLSNKCACVCVRAQKWPHTLA